MESGERARQSVILQLELLITPIKLVDIYAYPEDVQKWSARMGFAFPLGYVAFPRENA